MNWILLPFKIAAYGILFSLILSEMHDQTLFYISFLKFLPKRVTGGKHLSKNVFAKGIF